MKRAFLVAAALCFTFYAASGCASFRPFRGEAKQAPEAGPTAVRATDPKHTYALLLNGGGRRETNYQSHLIHLKQVVALLGETRIDPEHVTIFSGDGSDPTPDLATRELVQERDLWLLPRGGGSLRPEIGYVNSTIEGFTLEPAKKDEIRAWFDTVGKKLGKGDTLLLYVTDHGEKNAKDLANNRITLWQESLSVDELRELMSKLDRHVRVVEMMSQCFSGAFARTIYPWSEKDAAAKAAADKAAGSGTSAKADKEVAASPAGEDKKDAGEEAKSGGHETALSVATTHDADDVIEEDPSGNVCGYFSVTADRPAYGCYPENRGKEGIGHSHTMFEALDVLGFLPEANRRVQVSDRTPDVPHTSADFYLEQLLERVAKGSGKDVTETVDGLLAEAWQDRAAWEPEIRLLDRIGHTFGTFSPRSLTELNEQSKSLPDFAKQLRTYGDRWSAALEALKVENWQSFLEANPKWRDWLDPKTQAALNAKARSDLLHDLLPDLEAFSRKDAKRWARLESLRDKAQEANPAAYRAEVRLGAVLRMEVILTSIAGRVYLAQHGTKAERAAYEKLTQCEALALGPAPTATSAAALEPPEAFPTMADERSLVEEVTPAWMGIEYRPLPEEQQKKHRTKRGAVFVTNVFDDSPAAQAGLQTGDIVLGPPNAPFAEPHAIREWTMRSEIGKPEALKVLREDHVREVSLRPAPFPLKLPDLPGPPPVGSKAPPLKVGMLRNGRQVVDAKSKLLFFWATWCLPCKASLPEVLAFSKQRGIEVLAITDEDPELLKQFFAKTNAPFAEDVAVDPLRLAFRDYGVSGTPTFVLVDEQGIVRHYQSGYQPEVGLGIEGWKWKQAATDE